MSFVSSIAKVIGGLGLIVEGAAVTAAGVYDGLPWAIKLGQAMEVSGVGLIIGGIGSMISGAPPVKGIATTTRNSIAPWRVAYGRVRMGGQCHFT